MDEDGLLAAGVPGVQLTWMDAKIGDWVVTPRIGKPVEVQALWLNALRIGRAAGAGLGRALPPRAGLVPAALLERAARGCLYDVVDVDHVAGPQRRPRCGRTRSSRSAACPTRSWSSPTPRRVVETVERELLTPLGLRSLAPGEPGYRATYGGGVLGARLRLSPGHRLALADGPVRRGLAARARQHAGGQARGRTSASSRRCARISRSPASATSPRSPMPSRRTARAAARSRPGRWASCCASAGCSPTSARPPPAACVA